MTGNVRKQTTRTRIQTTVSHIGVQHLNHYSICQLHSTNIFLLFQTFPPNGWRMFLTLYLRLSLLSYLIRHSTLRSHSSSIRSERLVYYISEPLQKGKYLQTFSILVLETVFVSRIKKKAKNTHSPDLCCLLPAYTFWRSRNSPSLQGLPSQVSTVWEGIQGAGCNSEWDSRQPMSTSLGTIRDANKNRYLTGSVLRVSRPGGGT